ncbi:putative l-ascorbate oxidase protein [Botrytis fragariae]|uniref:Peroxidase n=1 Tax=Botrytis fragariae TaxID=1964551 RepID=A0A8H6AY94_9HELO|nr:putative l-ascorbate oxidase protein [Botrytis fragariae]KAF5875650.1 putative l-ascorbate oxidase protein [Botrytis fragariae]
MEFIGTETLTKLYHRYRLGNDGTNSNGLLKGVSSFLNYALGSSNQGEQTSAQWVRFAFHEFVTADTATGTGGMDAPPGFESTRGENHGLFVNDFLTFFKPTVNAYLSMSDIAALAVAASVGKCGGSSSGTRLHVGRIDATSAGRAGVPGPATDLNTTLSQFAAAVFHASEAITLTACGHSLGRVHNYDTPNVVNSSFVTATNIDEGEPFDSTPGVLDPNNINEYLNGNVSRGGPLCTAANVADRSDYRLYTSDNNAAIQSMSEEKAFQTKCNSFQPYGMESSGRDDGYVLVWRCFYLRTYPNLYTTIRPPKNISYSTTSSTGNSSTGTSSNSSGTGTSIFGSTIYWPFNSTIASGTTSLSSNNVSYPVNDNVFVLPAQSSFDSSSGSIIVKSAALTSASGNEYMTAVLYVPTEEEGTISPKIVQQNVTLTSFGTAGAYTLYSNTIKVSSTGTVIARVAQGDYSSRTVKSTTFAS